MWTNAFILISIDTFSLRIAYSLMLLLFNYFGDQRIFRVAVRYIMNVALNVYLFISIFFTLYSRFWFQTMEYPVFTRQVMQPSFSFSPLTEMRACVFSITHLSAPLSLELEVYASQCHYWTFAGFYQLHYVFLWLKSSNWRFRLSAIVLVYEIIIRFSFKVKCRNLEHTNLCFRFFPFQNIS